MVMQDYITACERLTFKDKSAKRIYKIISIIALTFLTI